MTRGDALQMSGILGKNATAKDLFDCVKVFVTAVKMMGVPDHLLILGVLSGLGKRS